MKIIDEKGRLFGKLSVIDLLVVLILIAAAAFVGVRLARRSTGPITSSNEVTMVYTVRVSNIEPASYDVVKRFVDKELGLKDQLLTSSTLASGYVVDCVAVPHSEYVTTADGGMVLAVSSGDDQRLDLYFTMEATITDTVTNKVGSQETRVGANHTVKTAHFEFNNGTVLTAEWSYENE